MRTKFKVNYKMRKALNSGLTVICGLLIVLSFQNCSELDQASVVTVTDVEQQLLQDLPFAYDFKIDQLAYMSCSGQFANDSKSFTIKAGGYFPGSGVGLRSNFLSQISNLNVDTQVRSLTISDRNDQAGVIMNVRPRNNLQDYVAPSQSFQGQGEITTGNLMYNPQQGILLSNDRIAKQLLALGPGGYLNYAAGLPGLFNKTFDGVFRINTNASTENAIRNQLRNTHYLAFTYPEDLSLQTVPEKPLSIVRSPYGTSSGDSRVRTSVFGTGYVLGFQQFDPRMTTVPSRIMSVQSAVNLENNNFLSESWDCSERFVIVRPEDASRLTFQTQNTPNDQSDDQIICDTRSDRTPTNFNEQQRWDRIRNILPVEEWYVNLPDSNYLGSGRSRPGCIVPKGNDTCYDEDVLRDPSSNIRVAYYYEEDLDLTNPLISYNGACGPGTSFVCPHFVTICYKR